MGEGTLGLGDRRYTADLLCELVECEGAGGLAKETAFHLHRCRHGVLTPVRVRLVFRVEVCA